MRSLGIWLGVLLVGLGLVGTGLWYFTQAERPSDDGEANQLQPVPVVVNWDATHTQLAGLTSIDQALGDTTTPVPDTQTLSAALAGALNGYDWDAAGVVLDADTGKVLFADDEATPIVPASSLKILTGLAVLDQLGPEHRFTTTAMIEKDTIYLVGGGDSMLGSEESDPKEVMGRAGLGTLAKDVAQHAQADTKYQVVVDASAYSGPGYSEQWESEIIASGNIAPVRSITLYGGRAADNRSNRRVSEPAEYAGKKFVEALEEAGVEASFSRVEYEPGVHTGQPVTVESATVAEQVEYMLDISDNQVAETLARQAAIAGGFGTDYAATTALLTQTAEKLKINTTDLEIADASGLSENNYVTPLQLTQMLMVVDYTPALQAVDRGLAVAGKSGTLRKRMTDDPYAGVVRGKTGTLAISSTLTGTTTTQDGRRLFFMFGAPGIELADVLDARQQQDRLATALTDCGC